MPHLGKGIHGLALTPVLILALLPLAGCGGLSSTGGSDIGTGATTNPSPTVAKSPAAERPALELWTDYGAPEGHEIGRYETLRQIVRWSHAIVRGRVTSVYGDLAYGDDDPGLRDIVAPLEAIESFKGPFEVGQQVPFVYGQTEQGNVEERYAELVGSEGIFFLAEFGRDRPEFGITGLPVEGRSGMWIPVTSQGVVIDDRGTPIFTATGFPANVSSIKELETRIREILAGG